MTPDHPREFIFTDKGGAHLAGEAVGPDTRSYHGFYIAMHEVVDGWSLLVEDGTVVGPTTVVEAVVTPDHLIRRHRLPGGDGEVDRSEGDIHPLGNPHYWLDPNNLLIMAHTVEEALARFDPEHATSNAANSAVPTPSLM